MQNIKILLDGIAQDLDDINGTNGASFTFRSKNENGESAFSFSPELTFTGTAYEYVKANILLAPIPTLAQIIVTILDDCCNDLSGVPIVIFDGKIDGSDVEWCEFPCQECTVSIISNSEDAKAIQCLKNTIIWARKARFDGSIGPNGNPMITDGFDEGRRANSTAYCNEVRPSYLHELMMIVGFVFLVGLLPALLVVATIGFLIQQIGLILGLGFPPIQGNFYDQVIGVVSTYQQLVTGCGYTHKTPFISSYLQNGCAICGLSLQSSIFGVGGVYENTMRLDAQFAPGELVDPLGSFFKNAPNLNFVQFMDEFSQFNIEWRVSNSVLIIERRDFDFGGQWFDVADIEKDDLISLCFSISDLKPAAYAEYDYQKDGVDNTGDEVRPGWQEPVFDWNVPPNPAQSGLFSNNIYFGAAQFRNDGNRLKISSLDKQIYAVIYPVLNQTEDVLLLEKGICNFPKLLIWDGISDQDSARILRYPSAQLQNTFDYNIDFWVKENYQDGNGIARDTLYQRFFYIDNPRVSGIKTRNYTLQIVANCELLRTLSVDKTIQLPLMGVSVSATIDEIQFNSNTYQFIITGKV